MFVKGVVYEVSVWGIGRMDDMNLKNAVKKSWWMFWRKNTEIPKKAFKDERVIGDNIYPVKGKKVKDFARKFNFIHWGFKYKFFVPLLFFAEWILRKHGEDKVSGDWYNKNIKIYHASHEAAMHQLYRFFNNHPDSYRCYNTAHKISLTLALNDTVTREYLNFLMHEIGTRMQKEYQGKPCYHVVYTSTETYVPVYFSLGKRIMADGIPPSEAAASMEKVY